MIRDLDYAATADSVFTAHGSGYIVPWNEVADHVHVDNGYSLEGKQSPEDDYAEPMTAAMRRRRRYDTEYSMGEEEIRSISWTSGMAQTAIRRKIGSDSENVLFRPQTVVDLSLTSVRWKSICWWWL